ATTETPHPRAEALEGPLELHLAENEPRPARAMRERRPHRVRGPRIPRERELEHGATMAKGRLHVDARRRAHPPAEPVDEALDDVDPADGDALAAAARRAAQVGAAAARVAHEVGASTGTAGEDRLGHLARIADAIAIRVQLVRVRHSAIVAGVADAVAVAVVLRDVRDGRAVVARVPDLAVVA